jgi:hypothetical protein
MARWSVSQPHGIGDSRSLRSATNWQSYIANMPAARAHRVRSHTLDLALPRMAAVPEPHGVGEAGHRGPLAPSRLPALLALAVRARTIAISVSRPDGANYCVH